MALIKKLISPKIFSILILIFTISEISFNTSSQLNGITKEWGFASRSTYDKDIQSMEAILEYTKQQPDTFTRTEKLQTQTGNDSIKFNYNGISQFSSVRNRSASTTLDKLGFKSSGTNLNLRYANNTIIADSLFGISYNISETYPDKYGFHPSYQKDNLTLYKNQFALPIAFATQSLYKDVTFNDHTLDNQTQFLNQIAGLNEEYFYPINHHTDSGDSVVNLNGTDTEDATISYSIEVPDNSQVYLSMTKLNFSNDKKKQVDLIVNGEKKSFTTDNAFTFFNLGYTENKQTFDIQVKFPGNAQVSFESPTFYRLDTKKYTGAIGKIKENPVEVSSYKIKSL
ncbi:ABC transporter membrane-spanning protein [Streptococcus infantis SK1302]|uniref:ABC transporter membrane-spanning protein n=1 Tax=Streptococcus infantis SK1302 TaxID=871237 RepID=A0ABP2J511_9STRE|nr:ABC transporter membrane-spanning protein [Streptococcus infantis SK1302]